ncbi:hypothetical protein D2E92_23785 [Mycobacteroides abscessus]|uniref:hypothetical protein n=1 Tax=Mycobacteroides abscessus TaxID=36809 RepID=UPI000E699581|nr:hypothetical protein [Mycobacteroides abscessus]RIU22645.1 hypothetical protein D2E92_23785 [Mycobacteroides abscessus]
MKLEPTEAQRKAMAEATEAWNWYSCGPERRLDMVDDMIAAANSIPDGAPVGTIARRPDGEWIAVRREGYWGYRHLVGLSDDVAQLSSDDGADSWPVIFTPGEAVGSGPTTDGGETHDPTRDQGIQEYLDWIYTQINPDEEPDCGGDLCEDGIRWRTDPTAQQEPGESLARGLDDLAAGRVSRRDDYLEPEDPEYCGNCDGRKCMGCVFREYDHDCADDCPDCCTTARTPRVVDRLGVDEQGSRWRDKVGDKWWFSSLGGWRYQSHLDGIAGTGDPVGAYAPYVELIEPRVLPSLDCEEARDGTEWKFRLNGEPRSLVYRNNGWRYGEVGDRIGGRCGVSDGHAFIREFAPYIEVVGDPS